MQNQKMNAYQFLKRKLLNCEIMPGEYINEKELVLNSSYGRTPIREALILLKAENLVEIIPRQGTYASRITQESVQNLFSLRKLLEPAVAVSCRASIDLAALTAFDARMKTLSQQKEDTENRKRIYSLDMYFHRFIAAASRNPRITATMEPLLQETYRIGIFNSLSNTENAPAETYAQHSQIIHAILTENDGALRDMFLFHLNQGLISSLAALKHPQEIQESEDASR